MMAKSLHSSKNKKSNSFKPYDISNSLVRRVTSRVSQLLPQPTTWLNRFLSSKPNSPVSHAESQEDDEEFFQPPSKRMRHVYTSTELARQSTSSVDREAVTASREEEISPIRSIGTSTRQDFAVAGPSGLGRKDLFISSTPATYEHPVSTKINGEDLSDSESASCSSSLPPPVPEAERSSLLKTLSVSKQNVPSIPTSLVRGRTPLYRSKERKLDLSASSYPARGRVSFDRTVFNSPFKGRLGTSSLSTSLLSSSRDESTFYSGPTMYGGASGNSDSLLRTRILHSEVPEIVKPSEPARPFSSNLASSTAKILKALEQFSTPVIEAKKMPMREGGLKRKAPAPYRELLVIPQMPDLLRIKRRDARRLERRPSSDMTTAASKVASCSSSMVTTVQQTTSQQLIDQRLKKDENLTKELHETSEKRIPTPEPNKIPSLTFSSLPKFDPGIVKPITHSPKPLQTPDPPSKPKETSIGPTSSTYFKFSKPINVSENLNSIAPIPLTKKFSTPLDPDTSKFVSKFDLGSNKKSLSNCINNDGLEKMTYTPPSQVTLKRKQPSNESKNEALNEIKIISSSTLSKNLSNALNSSSLKWECSQCYVSNDSDKKLCIACNSPKVTFPKDTKVGFGDKFKLNPQEWECNTCLVRNKDASLQCVACGYSKDDDKGKKLNAVSNFGDKFKVTSSSSEVKKNLVSNKTNDSLGSSSISHKEGKETSSSQPLSSIFKKPEGSWECETCLIQNKNDVNECVACNSKRPGFKEDKQQTFSFGALGKKVEDKPAATFSFGLPTTTLSNSVPSEHFKFGASSPQVSEQTSTSMKFTFGFPPKATNEEKKPDPVAVPNSLFSNSVKGNIFGNGGSNTPFLKSDNVSTEEKPAVSTIEKPVFSFGSASKDSSNNLGNVTSTCSVNSSVPQTTNFTSFRTGKSEVPTNSVTVSSTNDAKPISSVPNPIFSFGSASAPLSGLNKENCISQEPNKAVESAPLFNSTPSSVFNDVKPGPDVSLSKSKTFNIFNKNDNLFPKCDTKQVPFPFGSNGGVETKTVTFPNQEQKQEGGFAFNINKSDTQIATNMTHSDSSKPFLSGSFNNAGFGGSFTGAKSVPEKPLIPPSLNSHPTSTGGFSMKPQDNQGAQTFSFVPKDPPNQSSNPISFGANTNHTNSFTSSGQMGAGMADGFASNQSSSTFGGSSTSGFNFVQIQPVQSTAYSFVAASDRPSTFPSQGSSTVNNLGSSGGFPFSQPQNSTTQAPSFDPNVKPVYKFSAGPAPTFSATAANPVGSETVNTKHPPRIIRKAVRRTQK